ncbi:MAG: hypothetical protein HKM95_09390, partial [Inquilinus sp.]|nr:hypothetical protein [Inquilinus sp.]
MTRALRYAAQAVLYIAVAAVLGYLSVGPSYTHFPPDKAMVRLSIAHGADRRGECRELSLDERQQLAPNMRVPMVCPRERLPVHVEIDLDGEPLYVADLAPTGLSGDGPSRANKAFVVAPGRHMMSMRLRDTARTNGFDYDRTVEVELAPQQHLVIDFRPDIGGFTI